MMMTAPKLGEREGERERERERENPDNKGT